MDKFSDLAPIIIGIIIFVVKIISDANKKQQEQKKTSQPANRKERAYQSPASQKQSYQSGQIPQVNTRIDTYNWEVNKTSDSDYRSLDPKYVPQVMPDVDYDKMGNVNVDSIPQITLGFIEKTDNKKLISIRNKFKQKDTLKELYLLSEILNKPKAYRKWPRSIY